MQALANCTENTTSPTSSVNIAHAVALLCCVVNTLLSLTAICGNFLALGAIWKTSSLHSPTNVLFFGLALSDLGVGLIVQPLYVGTLATSDHLNDLIKSFYLLQAFFVCVKVLTLTAVTCDRFLAIFLHLRYRTVVSVKRAKFVLSVIWITSALNGSTIIWADQIYQKLTVALISIFILANTVFYFMIQRVVQRHQAHIKNQSQVHMQQDNGAENITRFKKSFNNLVVMYILLLLCYTPYLCTRVAILFTGWTASHEVALNVVITLVYVNSSLNPVFYYWRMGELRIAMKQFLKTLCVR